MILFQRSKREWQKESAVLCYHATERMARRSTDHPLMRGIKVNYMQSDVATLDRVEIIRDLRQGLTYWLELTLRKDSYSEVSSCSYSDVQTVGFLRTEGLSYSDQGRMKRFWPGHVCR